MASLANSIDKDFDVLGWSRSNLVAAEKVVFPESPIDIFNRLPGANLNLLRDLVDQQKLIYENLWVEWGLGDGVLIGVLLNREPPLDGKDLIRICIVAGRVSSPPKLIAVAGVRGEGRERGLRITYQITEMDVQYILEAMTNVFLSMWLLQQQGLVTKHATTFGPGAQKAQKKRNKPPLLDFTRITVNLGNYQSGTHVGSLQGDRAATRYHSVMGHLRTLHRDTPEQRVVWIKPFFRGDPALGFVNKEKIVKLHD